MKPSLSIQLVRKSEFGNIWLGPRQVLVTGTMELIKPTTGILCLSFWFSVSVHLFVIEFIIKDASAFTCHNKLSTKIHHFFFISGTLATSASCLSKVPIVSNDFQ